MSDQSLPPQRRQPPSGSGGAGGPRLSPAQGALEAQKRLGLTCYHAGQKVVGMVGCVACQFQIRNRSALPTCPQCGEMVWAWLDEGPAPVPEDLTEEERAAHEKAQAELSQPPTVEEGVSLEAPPEVTVEENVKLEP
jgi:hypothetical protein